MGGQIVGIMGNPIIASQEPETPATDYQPVEIPISAILEDQAFDAHQDYKTLCQNMGKPGFDPNSKPPAWKCILDEAIYTIGADPMFSAGGWPVRDVLMKIVTLGLAAARNEISAEKSHE